MIDKAQNRTTPIQKTTRKVLDESVEGDLILAQINNDDDMVKSLNEQEREEQECSDDDSFEDLERINEDVSEKEISLNERSIRKSIVNTMNK